MATVHIAYLSRFAANYLVSPSCSSTSSTIQKSDDLTSPIVQYLTYAYVRVLEEYARREEVTFFAQN